MKSRYRVYPGKELIVIDAQGSADLAATKNLVKQIPILPGYDKEYEILLDLRDLDCQISAVGMYELATWMAPPHPALPTQRKIAIVKGEANNFDESEFFALCARNRGLQARVFRTMDEACAWLDASPIRESEGQKDVNQPSA